MCKSALFDRYTFAHRGHMSRMELQTIVSCIVVAGNWTQDLWKSRKVFLSTESSFQLISLLSYITQSRNILLRMD